MQKEQSKKEFKVIVDEYFIKKYSQLTSTTQKIIVKHKRNLESGNVIGEAYLYVLKNEDKIKEFAIKFGKTLEHIIYSFCLQFINQALFWEESQLNKENNKLFNKVERLDDIIRFEDLFGDQDELPKTVCYTTNLESNIYTAEFIQSFYLSLNKLDAICFNVYYYEGIDNAKDFSKHFGISLSSAYISINRLKMLLEYYIKKNQLI